MVKFIFHRCLRLVFPSESTRETINLSFVTVCCAPVTYIDGSVEKAGKKEVHEIRVETQNVRNMLEFRTAIGEVLKLLSKAKLSRTLRKHGMGAKTA
jgi:hypothetical protein